MSGWQVGDLALCVDVSERWVGNYIATAGEYLKKGGVYRVDHLSMLDANGLPGIGLYIYSNDFTGHRSAGSWRFRKIKPNTEGANEDDAAWLKDLLSKPKVQA